MIYNNVLLEKGMIEGLIRLSNQTITHHKCHLIRLAYCALGSMGCGTGILNTRHSGMRMVAVVFGRNLTTG